MSFVFNKCFTSAGVEIKGLYHVLPSVFPDKRGYFFEAYNEKEFFAAGLTMRFVQDNQSLSSGGVLRGLHFQTVHPQGKLIRVPYGCVYDVAVDLRSGSETFGGYCAVVLDGDRQNQFYIPEGFAHGFYVLSPVAVCCYKCTSFYDPHGEGGIAWNDSLLGIDWPLAVNPEVYRHCSKASDTFSLSAPEAAPQPSSGVGAGVCCPSGAGAAAHCPADVTAGVRTPFSAGISTPFSADISSPHTSGAGVCCPSGAGDRAYCFHGAAPVLSDKDCNRPAFDRNYDYFDINGRWIGK